MLRDDIGFKSNKTLLKLMAHSITNQGGGGKVGKGASYTKCSIKRALEYYEMMNFTRVIETPDITRQDRKEKTRRKFYFVTPTTPIFIV